MKKWLSALLCAVMLLSLCACGAPAPQQENPTEELVMEDVKQESTEREYIDCWGGYAYADNAVMDDGTSIYCLIVKPEKEGTFPIVYAQTMYMAPTDTLTEDYISGSTLSGQFVKAGYAVVIAQTRGTGNSTFESNLPYIYDTTDELQILDWVRGQDFYGGEIFSFGSSYLGYTALTAACGNAPDVKAVCADVPVSTRYDAWYQNGFMKIGLMGYWQAMCYRPAGFDSGVLFTKMGGDMSLFNTFPYINWPVEMYGYQEEYWTDIITHPENSDWWKEQSPGHEIYSVIENLDTPLLLVDRFYDIFFEDSLQIWNGLSDEMREKSALVLQQYAHGGKAYAEGYWPFNVDDSEDVTACAIDFFDSVRAGTEPTLSTLGSVTYCPIDGDRDYVEEGTLTQGSEKHVLYLNQHDIAQTAETEGARTYTYDPNNPAVFTGGDDENANSSNGLYAGPGVEYEPDSRQDILSFLGSAVEEETWIKGEITGEITVSSDCEDTCFLMRVYLVRDGAAYGVREDITSLCYQLGDYTPGEKVTLHFETSPVVLHMRPGDSLRVDISSSSAGQYSLHTNVKGNQWEIAEPKTANNTVYTGISSITYYTEDLAA